PPAFAHTAAADAAATTDSMIRYVLAIACAWTLAASVQIGATDLNRPGDDYEHEHEQKYTCLMHPEVITDHPGNCPKCGMKLVPVPEKKRSTSNAVKARGAHGALRAQRPTPNLSAVASDKEDASHETRLRSHGGREMHLPSHAGHEH